MVEVQTRFLCPFFFQWGATESATAALESLRLPGRTFAIWERARAPSSYREDLLPHVDSFMFPEVEPGYVRVTNAAANSLLPPGARARLDGGRSLALGLIHGAGIELYLSARGVGVLSIALAPAGQLSQADALSFNYRLARASALSPAAILVPHPADDEPRWARLSAEDRARVPAAPEPDAPAADRIGRPGGAFTTVELVDVLLRPLEASNRRLVQRSLSVYTVARFAAGTDLDDVATAPQAASMLSRLAQVEGESHPGPASGEIPMAHARLNRCHWAAVGLLGAAHVVADQAQVDGEPHPFNTERVSRVRDRYFIPYLVALIQRLYLQRSIADAGAIVADADARRFRRLRTALLEFGIGGQFSQVSSREALHQFYLVARRGLHVPEAWQDARQAVADLDAAWAENRERGLADKVAENVTEITRVQRIVHAIEYLVASVYFAELWHMFAGENPVLYESARHALSGFVPESRFPSEGMFVGLGALAWGAVGLAAVAAFNRWVVKRP